MTWWDGLQSAHWDLTRQSLGSCQPPLHPDLLPRYSPDARSPVPSFVHTMWDLQWQLIALGLCCNLKLHRSSEGWIWGCGLWKAAERHLLWVNVSLRCAPPPFRNLFIERWPYKGGKGCHSTNKQPLATVCNPSPTPALISLRPTPPPPPPAATAPVLSASESGFFLGRSTDFNIWQFWFKSWHCYLLVTWWCKASCVSSVVSVPSSLKLERSCHLRLLEGLGWARHVLRHLKGTGAWDWKAVFKGLGLFNPGRGKQLSQYTWLKDYVPGMTRNTGT